MYADCRSGKRCCVSTCSSNLLTTTRSTIFDIKLRLEIGRYGLKSGSSDGFFSRGRTMACFKALGKIPSRSDAFTISARVPASGGIRRFTSEVGAGSSEQCFAGARPTIFVISSAVVSRNTDRQLHCRLAITAEDSPEVDARIVSILERKWMAKSSAECDEVVDICGIFCSVLIFDQRALKLPILDGMASDQ